jgi:NAD(P)-dependent dehydrogenase (short-subunit alcohol dehydrogenase family)
MSSMAAQVSAPLLGWYQASKRALEGVSDALRLELRPDGIRVVMVEPGMVRTDIWRGAQERLHQSAERPGAIGAWDRIIRGTWPLMADPDRVARAVHTALTVDRPRDRYPVGLDSQVLTRLAKVTPVAVTDTLARALFRLG